MKYFGVNTFQKYFLCLKISFINKISLSSHCATYQLAKITQQ